MRSDVGLADVHDSRRHGDDATGRQGWRADGDVSVKLTVTEAREVSMFASFAAEVERWLMINSE